MNGLRLIKQFLEQEGFEARIFSFSDMHDYLIIHRGGYYAFTLDVKDTSVMLWKLWTGFRHEIGPDRIFDLHHPNSLQDLTEYMNTNGATVKSRGWINHHQEVFA